MRNKFEELEVWQKSHLLVIKIYKTSATLPKDEKYRLGNQLRRSSASVATNIVEGSSRAHKKEFKQFLYLARGSLEETKYHLLLGRDLGYFDQKIYLQLQNGCEEVGRMLSGLIKSLTDR